MIKAFSAHWASLRPTNQWTLPHENEDELEDDKYVDDEKHDEMIVILPD